MQTGLQHIVGLICYNFAVHLQNYLLAVLKYWAYATGESNKVQAKGGGMKFEFRNWLRNLMSECLS